MIIYIFFVIQYEVLILWGTKYLVLFPYSNCIHQFCKPLTKYCYIWGVTVTIVGSPESWGDWREMNSTWYQIGGCEIFEIFPKTYTRLLFYDLIFFCRNSQFVNFPSQNVEKLTVVDSLSIQIYSVDRQSLHNHCIVPLCTVSCLWAIQEP